MEEQVRLEQLEGLAPADQQEQLDLQVAQEHLVWLDRLV